MKNKKVIIFTAALLAVTAAVLFISDDIISPYVSIAEAASRPGRYVQVIGNIDRLSPVESKIEGFIFSIKDDEGRAMRVFSSEARPLNFDQAEQAVVIGRYDQQRELFEADRLLIKCPSKYERKQ